MASVLETFLILFESNADDVDKGNEKAKQSADKLDGSLNKVNASTEQVGAAFVTMLTTAGGALASVLGVAAVISGVMSAADNADTLNDFTERLDLNIETVSAWGDAIALNGGTAEGFRGSIDALTDAVTTFAVKGQSRIAPFFKELGVEMLDAEGKARNVMDLLPEIADAFEGLSKQESSAIGKKIGLDQGTIMLLQQGRREVDAQIARQKELGVVTEEAAEIAATFNDEQDNTAKVFRSLFTQIGTTILPIFTSVLRGFQTVGAFLTKHSDLIVGVLIGLGAAVAIFVIPPFLTAAAAILAAFAPFLLFGAIVAALVAGFALLYDDIMNFIDGNDSLIGQILTAFPMIGDAIQVLIDYFMALFDAGSWVFETLASLIQIGIAAWGMLDDSVGNFVQGLIANSTILTSIVAAVMQAFASMGEGVGSVWDFLTAKVQGFLNLIRGVIGLVKSIAGGITGTLDAVKSNLGIGGLTEGKQALGMASASPISTQTSNSIANANRTSSKNTTVSTGPITVNTQATDAEGVAGAIGSSLGQQMRQATDTFDDGVEA